MTASILSIGTALPRTRIDQRMIRDLFAAQPGLDRRAGRLIHAAFDASDIDTRYTVLPDLAGHATSGLPMRRGDDLLRPTTAARNDEYRRAAPGLFADAAQRALDGAGLRAADVTHVITVSCTGLFAPGPDYRLVRDLGLRTSTERYHLGFVGCAAALPALRAAERFVRADPTAVVLVAAAELCSLHVQVSAEPDQIVASSVFADGAAAAIVADDRAGGRRLALHSFATDITDDGEEDMAWTVGDSGFLMTLTAEVPRIVGREIAGVIDRVFGGPDAIDAWAVHPGGRSILDRVEGALGLESDALAVSRAILREHGNMSSATILFVLGAILDDHRRPDGERVAAIAFGPGLTVETASLTLRTGATG